MLAPARGQPHFPSLGRKESKMKKESMTAVPKTRVLSRVLAEDLAANRGALSAQAFRTFTKPPEPWMPGDLD